MLFCNRLAAQTGVYNFSKIDVKNGLSDDHVNAIYRDSTGFIWVGTDDGLNRCDGYGCRIFSINSNKRESSTDNYVAEIFGFPGNKIWVSKSGNTAGIYNPVTEKFDPNFGKYLKALGLPQEKPVNIYQDRTNNYWFLYEGKGLYIHNSSTKKTRRLAFGAEEAINSTITSFSEDKKGNIWLAYANGWLVKIEVKSLLVIQKSQVLGNVANGKSFNFKIFVDDNGSIWSYLRGETRGVYLISGDLNKIINFSSASKRYRLNDNLIEGITQDKKGNIWIATDHGGINVVDTADYHKIVYVVNNATEKGSLSFNSIKLLYNDGRGFIWIGTGKKGLNYINQNIHQFELYQHQPDDKEGLQYNDINCFTEDKKGNLWIGTNGGGLIYFDRVHKKFNQFLNDIKNENSVAGNIIVSLCLDYEGKLWIGTYLKGMDVYDGKTFKHYKNKPSNPNSLSDDRVWSIMEDSDHTLWVGTMKGGLNHFYPGSQKFITYSPAGKDVPHIFSTYIAAVRKDSRGNLWLATSKGVEVFNKEKVGLTSYQHSESTNSLINNAVVDIYKDKRGLMWVATRYGLNVFNEDTKSFRRFTTDNGLPENNIQSITEDKHGNLLIATSKGISNLIIQNDQGNISFLVKNFNESNNLQGRVFNDRASLLLRDGKIAIGGPMGFNILNLDNVVPDNKNPSLVFTSIDIFSNEINVNQSINDNVTLTKALTSADQIILNYNENVFTIEFAALNFLQASQYAYKLDGYDENWVYANSESRRARYSNIEPGDYVFRVKATNNEGLWGDNIRSIRITIKSPYWKTPVAFILYLILTAGSIYFARKLLLSRARMRFEIEFQKKEAERVMTMDAIKTKFFTNVSHEFRTPLSLILAPLDQIIGTTHGVEQKKQIQLVQRNAKRLLNLVNQLLDFRKMEFGEFKLQPTEGDMVKAVKEICYSFSDLSEIKNISLSFYSNVDSYVTFYDRDKFEKIMFNLLSNAFKYTHNKGSIEVSMDSVGVNDENEEVEIIVRDSGIGIPFEKLDKIFARFFQIDIHDNITNPGTGIGLAITKEFVQLHNGNISVTSEPDKGTSFKVTLPVKKAAGANLLKTSVNENINTETERPSALKTAPQLTDQSQPLIMLVEDDVDFRFYLKDNLQRSYRIIEASNGQEAWEMLENTRPNLIVSDVMMPFMDGIELTKRIKANDNLAPIPIILLTAQGDEELQLESYKLGVSDYFTKPFTFELLASRLNNFIAENQSVKTKRFKALAISPAEIEITPSDQIFIQKVLTIIDKHMADPAFSVESLSNELFMHRAAIYRKVMAITGISPLEFIRQVRLKRGSQFLSKSQMTVSEIAYKVGFNNPKKFSQYFKEEFGMTPSQFLKQLPKIDADKPNMLD